MATLLKKKLKASFLVERTMGVMIFPLEGKVDLVGNVTSLSTVLVMDSKFVAPKIHISKY